MLRKSLLAIGFFAFMALGAALLNSCDSTDDTCGNLNYTVYEAVNFGGMPVEIIGTNNTGQNFAIGTYTNQEVRYDSIGLELSYDLNEISEVKNDFSFIKSAMACSLIPPYDFLHGLAVYSNTDYDTAHPAGTDLSDIIRVSVDLSTATKGSALDEEFDGSTFMIVLNQAPDQAGTHEFRIDFEYYGRNENTQSVQFSAVTIRP